MLELLDLERLGMLSDMLLVASAETDSATLSGQTSTGTVTFFSIQGLLTLAMLVLLQAVLGFDNLLYISIESKRVPEDKQSQVRKLGIALAIVFRIALLFVVIRLIKALQDPFFFIDKSFLSAAISGHSLIVLGGGAFILWTALKEIYHLLAIDDLEPDAGNKKGGSVGRAVALIVVMNLVFSFDSILSAMALTKNQWIMAVAIVISGLLMLLMADHVADFLKKNRLYEVLGLFILFIVGVMLVSEGGHLAEIKVFEHEIQAMTKTTFYFVLVVLILVDVAQGRFQKKLIAQREKQPDSP